MARGALKLSVRDLGAAVGVSANWISAIENGGDTRVTTLVKIETYFTGRGIVFLSPDQDGPGIRLRSSSNSSS